MDDKEVKEVFDQIIAKRVKAYQGIREAEAECEAKKNALKNDIRALRQEYLQLHQLIEGKYLVRKVPRAEEKLGFVVDKVTFSHVGSFDLHDLEISVNFKCLNSKGEPGRRYESVKVIGFQCPVLSEFSDTPTPNPAVRKTYTGWISIQDPCGEDEEVLFVGTSDEPIAALIKGGIKKHGSCLTVRYWVSDAPLSKDELTEEFLKKVMGASTAEYDVRYSEATGYLWTDQQLKVGGHDLLAELKSYEGYHLHMEIEYEY